MYSGKVPFVGPRHLPKFWAKRQPFRWLYKSHQWFDNFSPQWKINWIRIFSLFYCLDRQVFWFVCEYLSARINVYLFWFNWFWFLISFYIYISLKFNLHQLSQNFSSRSMSQKSLSKIILAAIVAISFLNQCATTESALIPLSPVAFRTDVLKINFDVYTTVRCLLNKFMSLNWRNPYLPGFYVDLGKAQRLVVWE